MTQQEFQDSFDSFFEHAQNMLMLKSKDYSRDDQALGDIEVLATELGMTRLQIAMVFATKHWTAIRRFIKDEHLDSETIHGRLIDMANYMAIIHAIVTHPKLPTHFEPLVKERCQKAVDSGEELRTEMLRSYLINVPHVFQGTNTPCDVCGLARAAKVHHVELRPPGMEPGPGGQNTAEQNRSIEVPEAPVDCSHRLKGGKCMFCDTPLPSCDGVGCKKEDGHIGPCN